MTRRPIRFDPEAIAGDICTALPNPLAAERFTALDLPPVLERLAVPGTFEALETGDTWPGRRMVIEPSITVGAFNLFAELSPEGTVLIIGLDIWPNGFPTIPE